MISIVVLNKYHILITLSQISEAKLATCVVILKKYHRPRCVLNYIPTILHASNKCGGIEEISQTLLCTNNIRTYYDKLTMTPGYNRCSVCGRVGCCCYGAYIADLKGVEYTSVSSLGDGKVYGSTASVTHTLSRTTEKVACKVCAVTAAVDEYNPFTTLTLCTHCSTTTTYCDHSRTNADKGYCYVRVSAPMTPALECAGPRSDMYNTRDIVAATGDHSITLYIDVLGVDMQLPVRPAPLSGSGITGSGLTKSETHLYKTQDAKVNSARGSFSLRTASLSIILCILCVFVLPVWSAEFRCDLWAADIASSPGFLCLCPPAGVGPSVPACVTSLPALPNRECHGTMVATCEDELDNNCRIKLFEQGRLGGCFGGICMLTNNCV